MMRLSIPLLLLAALALAGCSEGKKNSPNPCGDNHGHSHGDDDDDHGHGNGHDPHEGPEHVLGTASADGVSMRVTMTGEFRAGRMGVFDVDVTAGDVVAIRAWVGHGPEPGDAMVEKADGSGGHFHLHISAMETVPEDAKLWLEIETASGRHPVSVDLPAPGHDHNHNDHDHDHDDHDH